MVEFAFTGEQKEEIKKIAKYLEDFKKREIEKEERETEKKGEALKGYRNLISPSLVQGEIRRKYGVLVDSLSIIDLSSQVIAGIIMIRMIENEPCWECGGLPNIYKKKEEKICPVCFGTGLNRITES